jgi:hypothetical protein
MPGSKTTQTCKFIIKRGPKKGKPCGKACMSIYCKNHNKNRLAYSKKYNTNISKENKEKKFKQKLESLFKISDINKLPDLNNLKIKKLNLGSEINRLTKVKLGCMVLLKEKDDDIKKEFNKIMEIEATKLKNKYKCIYPAEAQNKYSFTDRAGIKYEGSLPCDCENCIDLRQKQTQPLFCPYTGKASLITKKYKSVTKKINQLKEKYKFTTKQIEAIEQIIEDKSNLESKKDKSMTVEI